MGIYSTARSGGYVSRKLFLDPSFSSFCFQINHPFVPPTSCSRILKGISMEMTSESPSKVLSWYSWWNTKIESFKKNKIEYKSVNHLSRDFFLSLINSVDLSWWQVYWIGRRGEWDEIQFGSIILMANLFWVMNLAL